MEGSRTVGDSTCMHSHRQAGVEHYETLAVFVLLAAAAAAHTALFAAACMASNSCPVEEPDMDVGEIWVKMSVSIFGLFLKSHSACVGLSA